MCANVNAKIVIIGCGVSGLAAAHKLIKAGFNGVRVIEATGRSGGRIKTEKLGERLCIRVVFFRFKGQGFPRFA